MTAEVIYFGIFDLQVCVPKEWTDEQVESFVNVAHPCVPDGRTSDLEWGIRKEGSEFLQGALERCPCEEHKENVHIMFDC